MRFCCCSGRFAAPEDEEDVRLGHSMWKFEFNTEAGQSSKLDRGVGPKTASQTSKASSHVSRTSVSMPFHAVASCEPLSASTGEALIKSTPRLNPAFRLFIQLCVRDQNSTTSDLSVRFQEGWGLWSKGFLIANHQLKTYRLVPYPNIINRREVSFDVSEIRAIVTSESGTADCGAHDLQDLGSVLCLTKKNPISANSAVLHFSTRRPNIVIEFSNGQHRAIFAAVTEILRSPALECLIVQIQTLSRKKLSVLNLKESSGAYSEPETTLEGLKRRPISTGLDLDDQAAPPTPSTVSGDTTPGGARNFSTVGSPRPLESVSSTPHHPSVHERTPTVLLASVLEHRASGDSASPFATDARVSPKVPFTRARPVVYNHCPSQSHHNQSAVRDPNDETYRQALKVRHSSGLDLLMSEMKRKISLQNQGIQAFSSSDEADTLTLNQTWKTLGSSQRRRRIPYLPLTSLPSERGGSATATKKNVLVTLDEKEAVEKKDEDVPFVELAASPPEQKPPQKLFPKRSLGSMFDIVTEGELYEDESEKVFGVKAIVTPRHPKLVSQLQEEQAKQSPEDNKAATASSAPLNATASPTVQAKTSDVKPPHLDLNTTVQDTPSGKKSTQPPSPVPPAKHLKPSAPLPQKKPLPQSPRGTPYTTGKEKRRVLFQRFFGKKKT